MSYFIDFGIGVASMALSAFIFALIPLAIKWGLNNYVGANIFIGAIFFISVVLISYTGGLYQSSVSTYLTIIPLLGLLLISPRMGLIWLGIVLLEILVFGTLQFTGTQFEQSYDLAYYNLFSFLAYFGNVVIVFLISNTFNDAKNTAMSVVENKNTELHREQKRSESLLLNILPEETAEELKNNGYSKARFHPNATILFSDFVGFTKIAENLTPEELVFRIDYYFKAFDSIIEKYNIEKIKTIGDAYMCAGGIPKPDDQHAERVINAAKEIIAFVEAEKKKNKDHFEIRIGISSGPVVSGVVGTKKFAYDIWGDAVNVASRMESNSESGKINISGSTYRLIKDKFPCSYRGKIDAKNKGRIEMYFA
jgi:class 3 adenylate cyclase